MKLMKLYNILIFSVLATSLVHAAEQALPAAQQQGTQYTAAELHVLELLHKDYASLTKEIVGKKKIGKSIKMAKRLLDPLLCSIYKWVVFALTSKLSGSNFKTASGACGGNFQTASNALKYWIFNRDKHYESIGTAHIYFPRHDNKQATYPPYKDFQNLDNILRASGFKYGIPARILTGLTLDILNDIVSAPRTTSIKSLDQLEEKLKEILSICNNGLDKPKTEDAVNNTFFMETLDLIERNFVLISGKMLHPDQQVFIMSKQFTEVLSRQIKTKSIFSIILQSLKIAFCTMFLHQWSHESLKAEDLTHDEFGCNAILTSFFISLVTLVTLYKIILPQKNDPKNVLRLGSIYNLISENRTKIFKIMQTQEFGQPEPDVNPEKDPKSPTEKLDPMPKGKANPNPTSTAPKATDSPSASSTAENEFAEWTEWDEEDLA